MTEHRNFIAGRWLESETGDWIENRNPATGDVIGPYPRSGEKDISMATAAADEARRSWKQTPPPERATYLVQAARYLESHRDVFARELCHEMGKPLDECTGDVQEAVDMAYFCAGEGRRNLGMVTSSEHADRVVMAVRDPVGVVGAITPWNYPLAMPAWKVMPALMAGNTVVLKPAEDTPHSALNLAKAFEAAGLPAGVFNVVNGIGEEAGQALVHDPAVKVISFTGSTDVGSAIAEACPRQFKRVALEMGGKNAVIVLDDANLDQAVSGIVRSVFATSGQRCSSAGRIIVQDGIVDELTTRLLRSTARLKLGNGLHPDTDIGPIINGTRLSAVDDAVRAAQDHGAQVLCGGSIATDGELQNGFFYEPTLLASVTPEMEIAQQEAFGPVAAILVVSDVTEAVAVANNVKYGLTSCVYTRDIDKAMYVAQQIEVGAFFINAPCVGAEIHLPFGGFKGSGNGRREGAHHMLDIYTEWKSISIQHRKSW